MKPSFVIYGNCQGGVLYEATKFIPGLRDEYDVVYYRSFDHPEEGLSAVSPEVMARCRYFWCQVDETHPFSFDGELPAGMKKVLYPSIDLGVLWPFQTHDPLFPSEPAYPFGMFPYGDRVLMRLAEAQTPPEQVVAGFDELARQQKFNFDRYLDIEMLRLIKREQGAHVHMAAWVLTHLRTNRLLWSYNHPTKETFAVLLNRVIAATFPETSDPGSDLHKLGDRVFATWDPFGAVHQTPVSAIVAQTLDLEWWSPEDRYCFHHDTHLTGDEFVEKYVSERIRRQT